MPKIKIPALSRNSFTSVGKKVDLYTLEVPSKIPELDSFHEISIKIDSSVMDKEKGELSESQFVNDEEYIDPCAILQKNGWSQRLKLFSDNDSSPLN